MGVLIRIFQLPIVFLNVFGLVGAFIWLLVIGEWKAVLIGVALMISAPFFLGLALLPTLLLAMPLEFFARRGFSIGVYLFSFLTGVYVCALITAWSAGVTFNFLHSTTGKVFWPMLIWSYCVVTSPWTYMAQKDGSDASVLTAFFIQAAFIVMMIALAFGADLKAGSQIFTLVMIVGIFFHMRFVAEVIRAGILRAG